MDVHTSKGIKSARRGIPLEFYHSLVAYGGLGIRSFRGTQLDLNKQRLRIHISGVTKCVTKFLTLSKTSHCDSVKNFVTFFVTPDVWTLIH